MSRWGKNIVVPLDSLCKEKENTNRPTVARSVGTVGKWGKMGFTSTRTYTLSALPAAMAAAAAAAAAAASPAQSPPSAIEDDLSPSVPEPPKPKKFFKSRNTAPPEVIAQIIQHLPRTSTSPIRDSLSASATPTHPGTPVHAREPIRLKIPKRNSAERKKKGSPRKTPAKATTPKTPLATTEDEDDEESRVLAAPTPERPAAPTEPAKHKKKKKDEKQLKPEAPPSRIISRARKTVNYCEVDDDDQRRAATPLKDIVVPKKSQPTSKDVSAPETSLDICPPPAALPPATAACAAPKTPEHPPIVLRISKGTSRLVSTDSDEQATDSPTHHQHHQFNDAEPTNSRHASSMEEPVPIGTAVPLPSTTPKIIVKPPKPPKSPSPHPSPTSAAAPPATLHVRRLDDVPETEPEFNFCTVKISPDKPPKERLKLIIKTDVIRTALAAAAAAAAAAEAKAAAGASSTTGVDGAVRPEKEKRAKSKKHKHLRHAAVEHLATTLTPGINAVTAGSEFKTPSPHLALGNSVDQHPVSARTLISPPSLSERDFDSQSSVLGSISSKGNSTPQLLAQSVLEESCVVRSRGSSVITSDLETSQHSSLVAPPSDIESRLESMMMDGEASQRVISTQEAVSVEEPLQEDILAVLCGGDESQAADAAATVEIIKLNGAIALSPKERAETAEAEVDAEADVDAVAADSKGGRRLTRGRGRGATKTNYADDVEMETDSAPTQKAPLAATRTRGRKAVAASTTKGEADESATPKRATRRGVKKNEEATSSAAIVVVVRDTSAAIAATPMEVDQAANLPTTETKPDGAPLDEEQENAAAIGDSPPATTARRGRLPRNASNNNNLCSNNNNNINKIAANLSAKAGAAEEAKNAVIVTVAMAPRSYGRKRKNQQVTQVLQPSAEEIEEQQHLPTPAKMANIDLPNSAEEAGQGEEAATPTSPLHGSSRRSYSASPTFDMHDSNSNSNHSVQRPASATPSSPPPRHDYKIKDKFKRTLTLDNQVNCNAVIDSPPTGGANHPPPEEEEQQRGAVKLVISKKKGSIFKSRALVHSAQSEQATAAKRHLYKHRWEPEANGGAVSDAAASPAQASDAQPPPSSSAAAIFDDFSEDLSPASASTRDNSPAMFGNVTRSIKLNVQTTRANPFDMDMDPDHMVATGETAVSGARADRKAKEYYTVVRNVKTAHQIQEIGEYQEMDDDVEYILDALQPHNPTPTRCLSALQLATKCLTPAFRMHVRAHGVVTKFFKALSDANRDLSLGLCTSAIMYILSQEGLNMDLDRDSLELMMNLLEAEGVADTPSDRANYERNRQKVRELCEEIKAQGKATHLNVDAITVGTLAMETLLSLTSKRAGEWFKEELRELGGLEHIIKTISECCRPLIERSSDDAIKWTQPLLENMQTVERCMRVLENVTQMNEENQRYILTYSEGAAVNTLCTLYCLCDQELKLHARNDAMMEAEGSSGRRDDPETVMRELLIPVMKVLIHLTHTFSSSDAFGAEMLGKRNDIIATSFHLLLQAPNYIPDRCVFELSILVLLLLINLTMHTKANRATLMRAYAPPDFVAAHHQVDNADESAATVSAVQAVMEYFYKCEEQARLVEKNTDALLDKTDKNKQKKKQEEVEETVNNLLQGAGHHMEHTVKGSYAGILIGHLITDSEENENVVRMHLHGSCFKEIISVLEKYYTFMNLTASSEASVMAHIKSTKQLIDYFRKRDLVHEFNGGTKNNSGLHPIDQETAQQTSTAASTSGAATTSAAGEPTSTSATTGTGTRSTAQRVYKTYSQR